MGSNTNAIIRSAERAFEGQRWQNKKKTTVTHTLCHGYNDGTLYCF